MSIIISINIYKHIFDIECELELINFDKYFIYCLLSILKYIYCSIDYRFLVI